MKKQHEGLRRSLANASYAAAATGLVQQAAHYAHAAAALSTCGYGAVAPLPRREAVLALLKDSGSREASGDAA
jgi:sugar/nucleoside kinase (ribokinase family)